MNKVAVMLIWFVHIAAIAISPNKAYWAPGVRTDTYFSCGLCFVLFFISLIVVIRLKYDPKPTLLGIWKLREFALYNSLFLSGITAYLFAKPASEDPSDFLRWFLFFAIVSLFGCFQK